MVLLLKKISILVENEIIVAIDSPDKISSHPLFENSEKIELSGTILPGLVDCHVHLIGFGDGTPGDVLVKTDDNLLAINGAQKCYKTSRFWSYNSQRFRSQKYVRLHDQRSF